MNRRLIAAAALALLAGTASAQPPAGPGGLPGLRGPGMGFGMGRDRGPGGFGLLQFDTNADGKLTRAEFDKAQHAAFDKVDANKDGAASPEEFQAARKIEMEARQANMAKTRFTEMDKDKNGQVSLAEFQAALAEHAPKGPDGQAGGRREMRFGPGGPSGGPGGGPGGGPMMMRERVMRMAQGGHGGPDMPGGPMMMRRGGPPPWVTGGQAAPGQTNGQPAAPAVPGPARGPMRAGPADANGDGKVTFAEFSAGPTEAFTRADANKDGTVTIAELQALAGPR
jgi:EF-hand domain pair/EF hand